MLNERIMNIFEENDITVHDRHEQDGKLLREIEFYSNAGEDVISVVWYDGTDEGFIKAFRQLADNFDADEHAEMWIDGRGQNGVPDSVRELIDDAEEIKETLLTVADELETVGRKKHTFDDVSENIPYPCTLDDLENVVEDYINYMDIALMNDEKEPFPNELRAELKEKNDRCMGLSLRYNSSLNLGGTQ